MVLIFLDRISLKDSVSMSVSGLYKTSSICIPIIQSSKLTFEKINAVSFPSKVSALSNLGDPIVGNRAE